ncbi:hypothetical protein GCM10011393_25140 [Sphingopyxis bauzanensis]|nr:hypothetical protein GCM10011393_25140 [Sphingopyxis bauzanensis]
MDCLVDAAVDGAIGLLVAGQSQRPDRDRMHHWQLADRAGFVIAAERAHLSTKDGKNFGLHGGD